MLSNDDPTAANVEHLEYLDAVIKEALRLYPPIHVGNRIVNDDAVIAGYQSVSYTHLDVYKRQVMGGTGALVNALVQLIEELGGRFYYNTEVSEIIVDGRRATGVRLADGTTHSADHVISNADVAWTYLNMIPSRARGVRNSDLRYRKLTRYSMSLVVIYFGTKKLYRHEGKLAHHNIILSERYQGLLADIFKAKQLPQDFSLYLHMPTLTDPSIAPDGHESFYVLSPVPHLGADVDWATAAKPYRDAIMQLLEDNYLPGLQANIVSEHMICLLYTSRCV